MNNYFVKVLQNQMLWAEMAEKVTASELKSLTICMAFGKPVASEYLLKITLIE